MPSDFIKLTWNDEPFYINAYRVNAVCVDQEGDTKILLSTGGQTANCSESPADVVAMIDKTVNGEAVMSAVGLGNFPGMEK